MATETAYTHRVEYQRKDGTWRAGFLGYTLREAKGVAREGMARTGRPVRVVRITR